MSLPTSFQGSNALTASQSNKSYSTNFSYNPLVSGTGGGIGGSVIAIAGVIAVIAFFWFLSRKKG